MKHWRPNWLTVIAAGALAVLSFSDVGRFGAPELVGVGYLFSAIAVGIGVYLIVGKLRE